jgi:hypothetical protein
MWTVIGRVRNEIIGKVGCYDRVFKRLRMGAGLIISKLVVDGKEGGGVCLTGKAEEARTLGWTKRQKANPQSMRDK